MTLTDILQRLDGVKERGGRYMARCPAHEDRNASLSLARGEDGRVLLKCFAGCSCEAVTEALGLRTGDLFPETAEAPAAREARPEAEYFYRGGELMKRKFRKADGSKFCTWYRRTAQGWASGRAGLEPGLYGMEEDPGPLVFLVEGEKDVQTLEPLGIRAVSLPDGAQSKWLPEYTERLRGRGVVILPDNDAPGRKYADLCARSLLGAAERVWVLDTAKLWEGLPEKGDISDVAAALGPEETSRRLAALFSGAEPWEPEPDPFLAAFKPLESFAQEKADWLIPGWIPRGQITLLAADGGVGKTTLWCSLLADLSAGRPTFLDPPDTCREPLEVAFCTTEDSVRKKLKEKLVEAGADTARIRVMDISEDREGLLRDFKFGTQDFGRFIRHYRPRLCVFDPVQGFVPPKVNMGSRNEMRACMAPLVALGEETGTTFLVVCHTNKRKGASGRDRIADSADLWDISRSVLMMGYTEEEGVRYLSNEKNNYASLQTTRLFSLESGKLTPRGRTPKRDRDYNREAQEARTPGKKEDCRRFLLETLAQAKDKTLSSQHLNQLAQEEGYSYSTVSRVRSELIKEGLVEVKRFGSPKHGNRAIYIELAEAPAFELLSYENATPFDFPSDIRK